MKCNGLLGAIVLMGLISFPAPAAQPASAQSPSLNIASLHLLEPFWKGETTWREGLFFIQEPNDARPSARLLFPPIKILALHSASGETQYDQGRDYLVDANSSRILLPEGSRIPFRKRADMYLPKGSKNSIACKNGEPNTFLYFSEGTVFHMQQCEVTYTHAPGLWKGFVPKYAGDELPLTMAKLKSAGTLSVCLLGDSITAGGNASRGVPPYMPAYGELACKGLEHAFGAKITCTNLSKGGATSEYGIQTAQKAADLKPDLLIIAFGMNDLGWRNSQKYKTNVARIIEVARRGNPQLEIILVATMRANPEWQHTQIEQFPKYRDALKELCGKGIVLANVTDLWTDLFQFKNYHDLTGNGVNHASDYGHRLYAQTVLSLFIESMTKP